MNMIERLKSNERLFGLCHREERICFEEVGVENCNIFAGDEDSPNNWEDAKSHSKRFLWWRSYRIKPDYAPQPKEKKVEVFQHCNELAYHKAPNKLRIQLLGEAVNDPDFIAFEYEDGEHYVTPRRINGLGLAAEIPKYVILAE